MIYEDFDLRIAADGEGQAVHATFRESRETSLLILPADLAGAEYGATRPTAGETADFEHQRQLQAADDGPPWPEHIGESLFQALLNGKVLRLFERSRGELAAQIDRGLRLRIHFDPQEPRLRPILSLPWELLYCAETSGFLSLGRRTPVVRSLDTPHPLRALSIEPPLRVLVAMAAPRQAEPLDLSGERRRIEEAFASHPEVELTFLEHATSKGLLRKVRSAEFQIVHFMGHGDQSEVERSGALILESPDGGVAPLTAPTFASFFKDIAEPALVVLNACRTASAPSGLGPLTGVAAALVVEGLPAVLAMRTDIEDRTALELSEEFYLRLAAREPMEAALTEARLALHTRRSSSLEWAIPALFVRGAVVPLTEAAKRPAVEAPRELKAETAPQAVGAKVAQTFNIGRLKKMTNVVGDVVHLNRGGRREH